MEQQTTEPRLGPEWAQPIPKKPRLWHDEEDSEQKIRAYYILNEKLEKYPGDVNNIPLRELEHQYARGFVDGIWFVRHYLTDFPAPVAWLFRRFVLPVIIRRQEMLRP